MNKIFKAIKTDEEAKAYVGKPEALANKCYANRTGNGDEASGDGWKYRGRGLIQLTGKANYAALAKDVTVDFVKNPGSRHVPVRGISSACSDHGLNELADAGAYVAFPAYQRKLDGFAETTDSVAPDVLSRASLARPAARCGGPRPPGRNLTASTV